MRPDTRAVHAGAESPHVSGLAPPLYLSSVYYARSVAEAVSLEDMDAPVSSYSRTANPTISQFEAAMAELEGGQSAVATPSGMAALTLVFLGLLGRDDRVVVSPHSYADTLAVLEEFSRGTGFEVSVVDLSAPDAAERVRRCRATVVVAETPSNPMLRLVDLAALSTVTRELGATLVVDSTMATPVNLRPLEWGADLVVHSASKYLAGHHSVIGGVIVGSTRRLTRLRHLRTITGICPDAHSAWQLLQGLKTLALRVERHNATAREVARFLDEHREVDFVAYPGLTGGEANGSAEKQMTGYGGVVTFGLRRGAEHLTAFLESLRLCTIAVSLGGVRTLIEAPKLMSHVQGGDDNASLSVIPDNAVRLSVGLEDPRDIVDDLAHGLATVANPRS